MARRENPEINAGSMADIAFLLLIFFLVTTTMNVDSGVSKKLSEKPPPDYVPPIIKEKNIFEVNINRNNELLVEDDRMELKDLKEAAKMFIDNGGGVGKPGEDGTPGLCRRYSALPAWALLHYVCDASVDHPPVCRVFNC